MGQDQVSGGVSVLCWLAAPVALFYGNLQNSVIRSISVLKSSSVINSHMQVPKGRNRVKLSMMRGGTLLILGHGVKVKVNFGTLCTRPCGDDTD